MNNIEAGPRDMVYNVKNYPDFIKAAPFCCWKQGKVPYNPITGKRAKVDETATFGTLEEAYRAYMGNSLYKGIGLKVSGRLGAIDLDKCVGDDVAKEFKPFALSSLSENAQKVLSMFPNAVVELSPSRTGLHLFFIVPEGFSFDRDEYYINNRNLGIEVYFPEITNRFLTVTGSLINTQQAAQATPTAQTPTADNETAVKEAKNSEAVAKNAAVDNTTVNDGIVNSEALQEFLDIFMKRPSTTRVDITLPEGGSILSDEEVKQKAARGKNGERFQSLYEGDWFKFGGSDVNWSQSEADIELCGILAFYCRGDINQMDRLFRASGLMRDKWDEARGDSTYGAITMNNAIANCHFFYDPKSEWEQKIDSFRALIDKIASEGNASTETLLSEETLMAAAWAIENDFARYVKLKKLIPSEIGVRAYEKQLKNCVLPSEPALPSSPLVLTGVEDTGLCVPKGWIG